MKKRLPALFLLAALLLTACTGSPASPPAPPATPPGTGEPGMMTFELTEAEKAAYDRIRSDKDDAHLQGLEPISVAKLYIQAALDRDYETEYALYYTDEVSEGSGWTLEDHLAIPEDDRPTQDEIYEVLVPLVEGEFIQPGNFQGFIRYRVFFHDTGEETDMGFQMKRNPNGPWKVSFLPLQ